MKTNDSTEATTDALFLIVGCLLLGFAIGKPEWGASAAMYAASAFCFACFFKVKRD